MARDDSVSNNLRATRVRLGLSQQQLAAAARITRQTVGGIEGGLYAPSAAVALRLARALGCGVEELFWLEEDRPIISAIPAAGWAGESSADSQGARVSLGRVRGSWIAHRLHGDSAFRSELVPADGTVEHVADGKWEIRVLDEPDRLMRTILVAGCAPALSLWARSAERWNPGLRVHWIHANSTESLKMLSRGEVHAAGIHFGGNASGPENRAHALSLLNGESAALVTMGVWEEGIVLAPGNPKSIHSAADLGRPDVKSVVRETGSGARILLESALAAANLTVGSIRRTVNEAHSHEEVARTVAMGGADAGLTTASTARMFGLDFLPIERVRYDIAFAADVVEESHVQQLIATLDHRWVRSQLSVLGGFDTAQTGAICDAA